MALSAVEKSILAQFLRIAKIKELIQADLAGSESSRFWALVDTTEDETYENRITGTQLTELDNNLNRGNVGTHLRQYISLLDQYARIDRNYTNGIKDLLLDWHLRMPQKTAEAFYEGNSQTIAAHLIAPDQNYAGNCLGDYDDVSDGVITKAANKELKALPVTVPGNLVVGDTRIGMKVTDDIAGGDSVVDAVFGAAGLGSSTTKTITGLTVPSGTSPGSIIKVGEVTVGSGTSVGATNISVSEASGVSNFFLGNMWIIIYENESSGTPHWEFVRLADGEGDGEGADTANNELNLVSGTTLKHAYTTSAKIYPCFNELVNITVNGSHDATDGTTEFIPLDDRAPALNDSDLSGI